MAFDSESEPLMSDSLGENDGVLAEPSAYCRMKRIIAGKARIQGHFERWKAIYLLVLFIVVSDFPGFARVAPQIRLFELGVCREYYRNHKPSVIGVDGGIDWVHCKATPVQTQLARLKGIFVMLEAIPGLLLAVPYGIMADTVGRRQVIALGLLGAALAELWCWIVFTFYNVFPIQALYASSVFLLLGGGSVVLSAVIVALIADNSPSHLRTRVFLLVAIVYLFTELIAPPIGSWLMNTMGANLTYFIGIPTRFLAMLLLIPIAEPLKDEHTNAEEPTAVSASRSVKTDLFKDKLGSMLQNVKYDLIPILRRHVIFLGVTSFLIATLAREMFGIAVQYMRVRFDWGYDDAAYLISFQAAVNIVMLLTVLPLLDHLLTKHFGNPKKDLILAKGSVVFLVVGPLYAGFSDEARGIFIACVIFAFGAGFGAGARSYLTSLVRSNEVALLYTLIAILSAVGSLVGAPTLGFMLAAGINAGGVALGLPFFFGAGMFLLSGICILAIPHAPSAERQVQGQEGFDEEQEALLGER